MLPQGTLDVHAHYLPAPYREALRSAGFTLLDGGIPVPEWSAESAIDMMDRMGIAGAVLSVSSPFASTVVGQDAPALCRAINDCAAELRDKYPDRFGAYAMLPVPMISESLTELDRALDDLQLDGVALPTNTDGIYLGDDRLAPLMDALNERGTTVFVHPNAPCCFETFGLQIPSPMIEFPFDTTRTILSLVYSQTREKRSNIRFIFSHGGGTLPFLAGRILHLGVPHFLGDRGLAPDETLKWLQTWHYDLASATASYQVDALRNIIPISQIVYGTDYPFAPVSAVEAGAKQFNSLSLSAHERKAIAHGNSAGLFPTFHRRCGCHVPAK